MRNLTLTVILAFLVSWFDAGSIFAKNVLLQENKTITGSVIEGSSGDGLPGVSIQIKGTSSGTVTDMDGNFSIQAKSTDILVFSFIGYLTEEISVGENTSLSVSLDEDVVGLDEVVVTGYGVQKKSDLTGAVASVSGEKIAEIPATSVAQALQGRAAGVSVTSQTGVPGSDVAIQIRGVTSINGTEPLVIVDGVRGSLSGLNTNDIQSVEVLKDASSAAIYGAAGGNGVILVTTKKGKSGKITSNFNAYRGWQSPWKDMDIMNAQEYGNYQNLLIAINNQGKAANKQQQPFSTMLDTLQNYDYQDEMFRTAIMENYDFSVSGGTEKSTYFASAGYLRQQGVMNNSEYSKMNIRINSDHQLSKWFKFGENITFTEETRDGFEPWQFQNEYNSPVPEILKMEPWVPPYSTRDENFMYSQDGIYPIFAGADTTQDRKWGFSSTTTNPFVRQDVSDILHKNYSSGGNFYLDITPIKGLVITSRVNAYTNFNRYDRYNIEYHYGPTVQLGNNEFAKSYAQQYGWEIQDYATYNFKLADVHNFSVMAGFESAYSEYDDMSATRVNLASDIPEMRYFDGSTNDTLTKQIPDGTGWQDARYAYYGRINYDFKSMLLLTANFRQDRSSRFGSQYRVGNFPSVSAGFKFTELDFFKNMSNLSFGKVRVGWGQNGANSPQRYAYNGRVSTEDAFKYPLTSGLQPQSGASLVQVPNPELHWETVIMTNIGLDLSFFNNKLNFSADYFSKGSEDMLTYLTLPGNVGYWQLPANSAQLGGNANPLVNAGKVMNKGIEFTVGYRHMEGQLTYSIDFNASYVKNKVIDLGEQDSLLAGTVGPNLRNLCITAEGNAMSQFFLFETDGLYTWDDAAINDEGKVYIKNQPYYVKTDGDTVFASPKAQPGDFRFVDANGDGKLDDNDRQVLGSPIPKFIMGLSANLEYKNFDLNLFLEGKFGHKLFNGSKIGYMSQDPGINALNLVNEQYHEEVVGLDGTVYPANTSTDLPRIDVKADNANFRASDFYLESGSYLRLKNIQLGYTIPLKIVNKVAVERLRIYVGATNLLTFTKYTGFDPEFSYTPVNDATGVTDMKQQGLDKVGNYPQNKMFMVGVNLQF